MSFPETLTTLLGGGLISLIGSIAYFRPRLKQARAESAKAETEAESQRANYLEQRINSMEKLYAHQGELLDEMRNKVLQLGADLQKKDERINQLVSENQKLTRKVELLEKEINSYRR